MDFKKIYATAKVPTRAHDTDAGWDLYAAFSSGLLPGGSGKISTGIAINIPMGYVGLICPRSGLAAKHNVTVLNAPGVIDCGFLDEIKVLMINHDPFDTYHIKAGDRVAQIVFVKLADLGYFDSFNEVEDFEPTERGEAGFGSSGV